MHFDARASVYERFRPPYPDALWTRLHDLGVLAPELRAVELGAGTGEATGRLVGSGLAVTAVEPGPALAGRLRERVPDAHVIVATAEEAGLEDAAYDVAFVATAVHWLDLDLTLPKLHRVLAPGGQLVVWRTVFGSNEDSTPFRQRVREIVASRAQPPQRPGTVDPHRWSDELTAGGYFAVRHRDEFRWSIELDADQVRGLFSTFSDWTDAEVDAAGCAVEELGGTVIEHYVTPLMVLGRVDAVL